MSKFRKILPYLIIVILSLSIIVAAWFVVPMFFKTEAPEVDNGDSDFIDSEIDIYEIEKYEPKLIEPTFIIEKF
jgi:hypothetical protein